jgi:hypothetical protein
MKLITAETIETFRTELDDYMDFRPTLKAPEPKTALDEALEGHVAPPPMFGDEDDETTSRKAVGGQYQFAPVVEKPAEPAAPKQAEEPINQTNSEPVQTDDYKLPPIIAQYRKKIKESKSTKNGKVEEHATRI